MKNVRSFLILPITAFLLTGCASGLYWIGEHDRPLKPEQLISEESSVVILSTRTQAQTTNNIYIYFIREGAEDGDKSQMIKIFRPAGVPLVGTYSTTREYQALAVPPGKYTLYAHTIGRFPDIRPGATKRLYSPEFAQGTTYRRGETTFEVKPQATTYIGDIWLEYPYRDNKDESKHVRLGKMSVRFGKPRLNEAKEFVQGFPNVNQNIEYNISFPDVRQSKVECGHIQKELFTPWACPEDENNSKP